MIHIHENRVVMTWVVNDTPLGMITGKLHFSENGLEVDWIVRFPESSSGTGEAMCLDMLPRIIAKYRLKWIVVKIRDNYHKEWLEKMAIRFGFEPQSRDNDVAFWRKNL